MWSVIWCCEKQKCVVFSAHRCVSRALVLLMRFSLSLSAFLPPPCLPSPCDGLVCSLF